MEEVKLNLTIQDIIKIIELLEYLLDCYYHSDVPIIKTDDIRTLIDKLKSISL